MKYVVFFEKEKRFEIKDDFLIVDKDFYIRQFREDSYVPRLVIECEHRTISIPLNQFIIEFRK